MKTFSIKTIGCKVNQYDTELIRQNLLNAGLREAAFDLADVCIINTCTVTAKSDRKSYQAIKRLAKLNPKARILVTGCGVDSKSTRVKNIKAVSQYIRNENKNKIAELISDKPYSTVQNINNFPDKDRAFVKIQDGCDNFCSYCIVPYVRGRPRSRNEDEVVKEVKELTKSGYKEIVLTGINLGHYGKDNNLSLLALINKVLAVKPLKRLRLSSLNPENITDELIKKIKKEDRICRHFHISIQSGDTDILKLMNRKYTRDDLNRLLNKIRKFMPDAGISGDFIIGHPGEKKDNFNNTLNLLKQHDFVRAHIFTYSMRPGTGAASIKHRAPDSQKKKRYAKLRQTADESSMRFKKRFIGKRLEVLLEEKKDKSTGLYGGYADNYIKMFMKGDLKYIKSHISGLIKVKIVGFVDNHLMAKPVTVEKKRL